MVDIYDVKTGKKIEVLDVPKAKQKANDLISEFNKGKHSLWLMSRKLYRIVELVGEHCDNIYKCDKCIKHCKDLDIFRERVLNTVYYIEHNFDPSVELELK